MNDGKQNYERQKARREMADEIRKASLIRADRERDMMMIFAGAVAVVAAGSVNQPFATVNHAVEAIAAALDAAKDKAGDANPAEDIEP